MIDRMRIGGVVVLVIGLAAFGCDDAADTLPDGFVDLCEGGNVPWVKNVTGSPGYDSMEVRDGRDAAGIKTIDKTGTPCAKATDKPACEAAYAAVDLKANGDVAFVATRGNDVIVKNVAQLDANVLGPIDNPHEAAVLAVGTRERAPLTCENNQLVGVKRNSGNFEVASISVDKCTGKRTRTITAVETNGSTRELQVESLTEGEPKFCDVSIATGLLPIGSPCSSRDPAGNPGCQWGPSRDGPSTHPLSADAGDESGMRKRGLRTNPSGVQIIPRHA